VFTPTQVFKWQGVHSLGLFRISGHRRGSPGYKREFPVIVEQEDNKRLPYGRYHQHQQDERPTAGREVKSRHGGHHERGLLVSGWEGKGREGTVHVSAARYKIPRFRLDTTAEPLNEPQYGSNTPTCTNVD